MERGAEKLDGELAVGLHPKNRTFFVTKNRKSNYRTHQKHINSYQQAAAAKWTLVFTSRSSPVKVKKYEIIIKNAWVCSTIIAFEQFLLHYLLKMFVFADNWKEFVN